MDYLAPDTILQQYRIVKVLGSGGFSVVYQAQDQMLDKPVAIKEYFPERFAQRSGVSVRANAASADNFIWGKQRFMEEAQVLARFNHSNIIRVIQIFEANNTAYMVLEYLPGRDFKTWLGEIDGPPNQLELDKVVRPILDALEVIHRNDLLHRDVAPDNIYICNDGTPVLLDFGSAKEAIGQRTRTVSAVVKDGYSPVEQYSTRGSGQGPWTDIYALAATLYHAVTGARPEDATERLLDDQYVSARKAAKADYRPAFLDAIDGGLKPRGKDRPQSIAEWRTALLEEQVREAPKTALQSERPTDAEQVHPHIPEFFHAERPILATEIVGAASRPSIPSHEKVWPFVLFLSALAVASALLTAFASDDPRHLLTLRGVPLLPGIYFGLVLCTGTYLWNSKRWYSLAMILGAVILGWVSAVEVSPWVTDQVISGLGKATEAFPDIAKLRMGIAGVAGGFVGSTITALGVHFAATNVPLRTFVVRTSVIGTAAGLLLVVGVARDLPLYLVWQCAVAASVAFAICRPTPDKAGSTPMTLIQPHQAAVLVVALIAFAGIGLYFKQHADQATAENTIYADGNPSYGKRDIAKLQAYLDTCTICENKTEALRAISDEKAFSAAGNDPDKLQAYINDCQDCAHQQDAQDLLDSIKQRASQANNAPAANASPEPRPPVDSAPVAPAPSATPAYTPPSAAFTITNNTSSTVHITFYDGNTLNAIDPPGGRTYIHAGNSTHAYQTSCAVGQLICYGAVRAGSALNPYWGVGYAGKQSCTQCCITCPGSSAQFINDGEARQPTPQVTFAMTNSTSTALSVAFYSQTRFQYGWPNWNQNYTMHYGENNFSLTCQAGEKICYGAWPFGNVDGIYWGVGSYSRFSCTNCCVTCDGTTHTIPALVEVH